MTRHYTHKTKDSRYGLTSDGELWRIGRYGYIAGYVMNADNIEDAASIADEEINILMTQVQIQINGKGMPQLSVRNKWRLKMTNDDRLKLEDRIIAYGEAMTRDGFKKMDRAWSNVMDAISDIQRKEERKDD